MLSADFSRSQLPAIIDPGWIASGVIAAAKPTAAQPFGQISPMSDRQFYLAMTLLILALAAGEIVLFGPFAAHSHRLTHQSRSIGHHPLITAMTQGTVRFGVGWLSDARDR